MSTASNDQGRAYEYAWICVLKEEIEQYRNVSVVDNSSLEANRRAWNNISVEKQEVFSTSAKSAVYQLIELEPLMTEKSEGITDLLILEFQGDELGKLGDVRDIVAHRDLLDWEVGFSIKHNHNAIKHSRLSSQLDFGKEWYGIACSDEYWNTVTPLFDWLNKEKLKGTRWSDIQDKDTKVYVLLLNAFIKEVKRAYTVDNNVPQKMVEYLIGKHDYYKLVSNDSKSKTTIVPFNLHNTLGKTGTNVESHNIPSTKLPTSLVDLKFKTNSTNTVEMTLNNGWKIKFRIHNASSIVEPSLKFDVQFVSMPDTIITYECVWIKD